MALNDMDLTIDQIKMLAEAERKMDTGELSFVVAEGQRMLIDPLIMDEFGLVSGQTVTNTIVIEILKAKIAMVKAQIAARRALKRS